MALHNEIEFEDEVCAALGSRGWMYAEGDANRYDRTAGRRGRLAINQVQPHAIDEGA